MFLNSRLRTSSFRDVFIKVSLPVLAILLLTRILSVLGAGIDVVYLISPADVAWINGTNDTIAFQFNFTGDNATADCQLFINETAYYSGNVNASTNTTWYANDTITEGLKIWQVNCTNGTAANSSIRTIYVDLTDPSVYLVSPANYINTSMSSLDFWFNVTDTLSPTMNCSLLINDTFTNNYNETTYNATETHFTNDVSEGMGQNWTVNCSDKAGNYHQPGAWNFSVDLTNPSMGDKLINRTGSVITNTVVCINVTGVSDSGSGVDKVWAEVTSPNGTTYNITMSVSGPCSGGANTYSTNIDVGYASGTFYYNASWVNDTSGRVNPNTTVQSLGVSPDTNVTSCKVLDLDNTHYTQTANIEPDADPCINITGENVTFDGNGFWIRNTTLKGTGIYSNRNNTTIMNCNVTMSGSSGGYGIELSNANRSFILNNTLNGQYYGLYLSSNDDTRIENNTADSNIYGIYLFQGSDSNVLENNTADSNKYHGTYLNLNSDNNTINNNTLNSNAYCGIRIESSSSNIIENNDIWNCSSAGAYSCIYIYNSDYNVFDSNRINKSHKYGIILYSFNMGGHSSNNVFKNTNMTNIDGTAVFLDDDDLDSVNKNNTFLNFTYSNETVDAYSVLIRKWHYRAYVKDGGGAAVPNASVEVYNSSSDLVGNLTTGPDGLTAKVELVDYINNGGTQYFHSNFTAYANKSGYVNVTNEHNITIEHNIVDDVFTLYVPDDPPDVASLDYPANNANLTSVPVDFNFTASDDRNVSNCTLWANFSGSWEANATVYNVANDTETNISVAPTDGYYVWNVLCWDNATSPQSDWYTSNFSVTIDANLPTITITYPSNKTYYNVTYFNFTADEPTDACWYSLNSGGNTSFACGNDTAINTLPDQPNSLEVYANDSADNIGGGTVHYTTDQTAPEYSGLIPNIANQSAYDPAYAYQLNSTWSDPSVMHTVLLEWESNNYTAANATSEYYYDIGPLAAGSYDYRWCGNDTMGNLNCTPMYTYTVSQADVLITNQFDVASPITYGQPHTPSCH
ncbi:MAG: right-handed parallel beta-helix repeat-containing protein, partial [Candidatus Aenigmarchaeota archaeon]|nr:right-handed parallel beta-helix repeat-containing protein [Candidatus Aenigmarchaeota archaeon]